MTNKKQIFIIISIVVFILDLIFVAINYYSSLHALNITLLDSLQEKQTHFNHTLSMVYRNMLQISEHYSQLNEYNQLFLKGKKAIKTEGGGKGGIEAQQARQMLLNKVKPGWDNMTSHFKVRQLHYHIGPGSLSFLRVHEPDKYGDRLDNVRNIIVDTNKEKVSRVGFETGRIFSGLRGVSPIWTIDPETHQEVYVGALEVGTSFEQILPIISNNYKTNLAVLLTKQHVEKNIWPELIQEAAQSYVQSKSNIDYYIESSSSKNLKVILSQINVPYDFISERVGLIKMNGQYISTFFFPFRDYSSTKNNQLPAIGFVLLWEDVSELIIEFHTNIIINVLFALIALIIIEVTLYLLFKHEIKLTNSAMFDGLTEIPNRRYFDEYLMLELRRAKRNKQIMSLLLCDLDYFKQFNDTYGHLAGDDCLRKVATTLTSNMKRAGDCVARFGGEEFTILLPDTSLNTAVQIAERLRNKINNLKIPHADSKINQFVTISIGVASTETIQKADELLAQADINLYAAKNKGRNRVEYEILN
ncbi:MAG: diguanylate cyclase [Gammaproteobacteria bacterium]|nr:diguanylate cyclase [Gammaproteobacteria bacterium]